MWALKELLDIPKTTPTPAVWYVTGHLMTSVLIDKRQMLYLKTLLDRPNEDWTKKMFNGLNRDNIGWVRQIKKILEKHGINQTFDEIKSISYGKWKKIVTEVTELKHKERLLEMCYSRNRERTKTKELIEKIQSDSYTRTQRTDILSKPRYKAKVQIMAMFHMLKCATNFKNGFTGVNCITCQVPDNENHRINNCILFKEINLYTSSLKIDFTFIYSNDEEAVERVLETVCTLWDLENGKNEMKPSGLL